MSYTHYLEKDGNPINEIGLVLGVITIHKHVAVLLRGFKRWTMRKDQQWTKCKVFFAYIGNMNFVHIKQISEEWLNKVAAKVPLGGVVTRAGKRKRLVECCAGSPPVKKKRGRPKKEVSPQDNKKSP